MRTRLHDAPTQTPSGAAGRPSDAMLGHPQTRLAFRRITRLAWGYLSLSLVAMAVIALLRDDQSEVNSAVWTRGVIVVVTALLLVAVTARAAAGSRSAYRRLRIISIVAPVAIAVIISTPGPFPVWMKIEQGICGLILVAVAVVVRGRHLRDLFATPHAG